MQSEHSTLPIVLSFDVEEHYRIEAANGIDCSSDLKSTFAERMESSTRRILDLLGQHQTPATFFIVGEIAKSHPRLIRDIAAAGHEIGTHGWDHQRVHRFDPSSFRQDLTMSRDALEQAGGAAVVGYRAPTFSVVRQTGWAVDVMNEVGLRYDSSIFPVRHDRYGIPDAPRTPFIAEGTAGSILELPPATYRLGGQNLPVAGGGYFRLFPLGVMRAGLRQLRSTTPGLGMLYFHPWEFDPEQPKLPLKRLSRWRTYVGIAKSMGRLERLIRRYAGQFRRAIDVVEQLDRSQLPRFRVAGTDPA